MRQFDKKTQDEICFKYDKEGGTLTFLAQTYHCRAEAIRNVLLSNNIKIRRRGQKTNRAIKENYFETIDTEKKAYFLGLFFADGNISLDKRRSPLIRISLKLSDKNVLEEFRNELEVNSKLLYDKRNKKESAILSFRSEKMANDLSKYGIVPNKTYITKHLPIVPQKLLKHFLRGLIDGDGSIYQSKKGQWFIDLCSYHESICADFQNLCLSFLNDKNKTKIVNYGTACHIRFGKKSQVKQLATVLYKDSNIYLTRKYEKVQQIFENNNEEDIVYSDH